MPWKLPSLYLVWLAKLVWKLALDTWGSNIGYWKHQIQCPSEASKEFESQTIQSYMEREWLFLGAKVPLGLFHVTFTVTETKKVSKNEILPVLLDVQYDTVINWYLILDIW